MHIDRTQFTNLFRSEIYATIMEVNLSATHLRCLLNSYFYVNIFSFVHYLIMSWDPTVTQESARWREEKSLDFCKIITTTWEYGIFMYDVSDFRQLFFIAFLPFNFHSHLFHAVTTTKIIWNCHKILPWINLYASSQLRLACFLRLLKSWQENQFTVKCMHRESI